MHRVELKVRPHLLCLLSVLVFLMHRVELKDVRIPLLFLRFLVPNAPCGVERSPQSKIHEFAFPFLMHRVELKEHYVVWYERKSRCS